ncbi:hypothetical protein [Asticcacaulis excentricus]|uniref:hypothetical protein n=1 Tax=Asticcacaulis excentricus TaxID=78587 RepID=UPI000F81CD59|nr:hypothetical protein [Asticcacaulis excentricus]
MNAVDTEIGKTRRWELAQKKRDDVSGIQSAEYIRASGNERPHQKAGHMPAPDRYQYTKIFLPIGSRPHMLPKNRGHLKLEFSN